MKQLPTEFKKNTFDYNQVWRDDTYAIYSQHDGDTARFIAYEVFKINRNEERIIAGVTIVASESVPPSTQWGFNAWTVATLKDAHEKVNQMREAALKSKTAEQQIE